jgi:hypothetical protein
VDDCAAIVACVRDAYTGYIVRMGAEPAPMLANYPGLIARGVVHVLEELTTGELLAFAEKQAGSASLAEVRLYTNEAMTENLAFYGRLGFEETGRRFEDGYKRVFLRKTLT